MSYPDPWVVHKFGGSSVADAGCFRRVAAILESAPPARLAVVVSACKGVTDALLRLVALAERQDEAYRHELAQLRARHAAIAQEVLSAPAVQTYLAGFDRDCQDLLGILHAVQLTRSAAHTVSELISGYGEIWSSRLFQRFFAERGRREGPVQWVDASQVVLVEWGSWGPGIQWTESRANLVALVPADFSGTLVITGFIAADRRGVRTTLGRNGSDFSASIFAALLGATEIHIWTDVDGVLSADPRRVPDATVIDSLSYDEAMELAYFGAKVIHPKTMAPAVKDGIPIWIRNTFAPGSRRHAHLRPAGVAAAGEGHHQHRSRRAREPRGHRHDRRARHRLSPLRRAARGGDLGDPHLPGQLRALDLLRDPARAGGARRRDRAPRVRARAEGRADPERRHRPGPGDPRRGRRRHGRYARDRRQGVHGPRRRGRQRARDRPGGLRAQHLRRGRGSQRHARAARGARRPLPVPAHALDRHHRPGRGRRGPHRSAGLTERAAAAPVQARPARARTAELAAHAAR